MKCPVLTIAWVFIELTINYKNSLWEVIWSVAVSENSMFPLTLYFYFFNFNVLNTISIHSWKRGVDIFISTYSKWRNFRGINCREFYFGHFAGIDFGELGFTQIFAVHKFLKYFAGINFRESLTLKDFAEIYFRESTFWGSKKKFNFAKFSCSENFFP